MWTPSTGVHRHDPAILSHDDGRIDGRALRVYPNRYAPTSRLFSDVFRDTEGDALTLTITRGDGSALPGWLTATRDPQTGEIVFTANPAANAADEDLVVKLTASETGSPTKPDPIRAWCYCRSWRQDAFSEQ